MTPFEMRLATLEAEHAQLVALVERQGNLILGLMEGMTTLAKGGAATNAHLSRTMEATTALLGLVADAARREQPAL